MLPLNIMISPARASVPRGNGSFFSRTALDPEYTEAHNNQGVTLANQGRYEEAIAQFSAALKINPGYAKARQNLEKSLKDRDNQ